MYGKSGEKEWQLKNLESSQQICIKYATAKKKNFRISSVAFYSLAPIAEMKKKKNTQEANGPNNAMISSWAFSPLKFMHER